MKDLKYLAALTIPLVAFTGLYYKGLFSFLTPVYAFVIIPVLELIFPIDNSNVTDVESKNKLKIDFLIGYCILICPLFTDS